MDYFILSGDETLMIIPSNNRILFWISLIKKTEEEGESTDMLTPLLLYKASR